MKRLVLVVLALGMLAVLQSPASAQTYTLQVANQHVVGTDFIFEIYMLRTGTTPIYLGNSDFALTFNAANFTSPAATVSAEGLVTGWYPFGATVSGDRVTLNVGMPPFSSQAQFDARVRNISNVTPLGDLVAQVTISGISTPSGTAGLQWHNVFPIPTALTTLANTTPWNGTPITNVAGHVAPDPAALPVTLTSFAGSANASRGGVVLEWKTASEVNNYGFTVQRKLESAQEYQDVANAFIAGKGTTVEAQSYTYVDKTLTAPGTYTYRLKQQDLDGTVHYTQGVNVTVTVTDVAEAAPKVFQLVQNYPNPFNPSTQVKFSVESNTKAVVKVYNMLGQEVATLFDGLAEAGRYYTSTFDAKGMASGIYLYRLTTDHKSDVRKMLLLR